MYMLIGNLPTINHCKLHVLIDGMFGGMTDTCILLYYNCYLAKTLYVSQAFTHTMYNYTTPYGPNDCVENVVNACSFYMSNAERHCC